MITDRIPKDIDLKAEYERSEALCMLRLPPEDWVRGLAANIELLLKKEEKKELQKVCSKLAAVICADADVAPPKVRILGVRPLEEVGDRVDETFGDYDFESARIRIWMRTAVLEKATAYGTFLSTLCHEICHHLDVVGLEFPNTFHTRGFYNRAGILYHHVRGTPMRKLAWDQQRDGTYRINWPKTMRGQPKG